MRIIVTGGRDYDNAGRIWRTLDLLDADERISVVIDGASDDVTGPYKGADYWGHQWALARNKPTTRVHADWTKHGKAAGPIRNKRMRDEQKPDLVVAFLPGGKGTMGMIKLAEEVGIKVHLVAAPPQS